MKAKSYNKVLTKIYQTLYEAFGPQHWWPGDTPFEIAVGAILTQNTNWSNVERAIDNLKSAGVMNAKSLHKLSHEELASLIRPAGYFNVKAKRLGHFLAFLMNHYRGSMKRMAEAETDTLRPALLDVNGIGPETADSILLYALDRPVFVIDAYTRRILLRHGLINDNAAYNDMQEFFHDNIRRDLEIFNEYHALLVMLGKDYCRPKPRCDKCPLNGLRP